MIDASLFLKQLTTSGYTFFTGVPDSLLSAFCSEITQEADQLCHITAANEGGAIALAAGYHLGTGKIPVVYMQNSGLGNAVNPLLSLVDEEVYQIPMLLIIGWRGRPGTKDEPQHIKQGRVTTSLLDTMEIPYFVVCQSTDYDSLIEKVTSLIQNTGIPHALVIAPDTFEKSNHQPTAAEGKGNLSREEALKVVVGELGSQDIIVSTTGKLSRELFEYRESKKESHQQDFLTVGSMGHASQIAAGITLSNPDRHVVCLDGDGALLMHLGALAINTTIGLTNFTHIVFNNGSHESVGGQPTVAQDIDLCAIASACGYNDVLSISPKTTIELKLMLQSKMSLKSAKPVFVEIVVDKKSRADLGRPTMSAKENKKTFMKFLAE